MKLDDLRPAWRRFTVVSAMQPVHPDEIGRMLGGEESASKAGRLVMPILIFLFLTIFCHGG